jgi:predicted RNase H-like HicB family nuclease
MHKYLVVIEKAKKNFSAYVPDLPGCVATGQTIKDVEENIYEAIRMHVNGLIEDHQAVPKCEALSEYIFLP